MLEGASTGLKNISRSPIPAFEARALSPAMDTAAAVRNPAVFFDQAHRRMEVGKMKPEPRRHHGCKIRRIQTEEPDARLIAVRHVGAHVELGERRKVRQCGSSAQAHSTHSERHNSQPRLAFKCVQRKSRRHERPDDLRRDGPVRKKKVVPHLRHNPGASRKRPRSVIQFTKRDIHRGSWLGSDKCYSLHVRTMRPLASYDKSTVTATVMIAAFS